MFVRIMFRQWRASDTVWSRSARETKHASGAEFSGMRQLGMQQQNAARMYRTVFDAAFNLRLTLSV